MSDEPKKRETAEEREERRRREIEGLMESMNRTAPKADTELLKSLRQVELSESPDKTHQERLSDITASSGPESTWRQAVRAPVAPFVSPQPRKGTMAFCFARSLSCKSAKPRSGRRTAGRRSVDRSKSRAVYRRSSNRRDWTSCQGISVPRYTRAWFSARFGRCLFACHDDFCETADR